MTTEAKSTRGIAFKKGNPGKPKGAVTKNTAAIKDMILTALSNAGGAEYLERRANDPRTAAAFLGLIGKVLPMTIVGDKDNPARIVFEWKREQS